MSDLMSQSRDVFVINKSDLEVKLEHKISDKKDMSDYINRCTK